MIFAKRAENRLHIIFFFFLISPFGNAQYETKKVHPPRQMKFFSTFYSRPLQLLIASLTHYPISFLNDNVKKSLLLCVNTHNTI